MNADQQVSTWERNGHKVLIGTVQTEVSKGKNRYYREISMDGRVIGRSQGKDIQTARYRSAFEVERALKK